METKNYYYFQYHADLPLPIYIRYEADTFEAGLSNFLRANKFKELDLKTVGEIQKNLHSIPGSRLLTIEEASVNIANQIEQTLETDKFGKESITPKDSYSIYRHRGAALMIWAYTAKEWTLAAHPDFGLSCSSEHRTIINRFLSWALVPHGIIGFWGVPVDDGIVVMKHAKTNGEAVFIDIRKRMLLSMDGAIRMKPFFTMMRLDPNLRGKNLKMRTEEFLSFLSVHCTYFDYTGLSIPVRQMIQTLSKTTQGIFHPEESFKPRTDLSLV